MDRQTNKHAVVDAPPVVLPDIRVMGQYSIPANVLIVGCGGTGAYVAGHLARLISVLKHNCSNWYDVRLHLVLADGDKVEQKNLERQHFIQRDLNANKAEVLASRYSAAFGLEITAVPYYLENTSAINMLDLQPLLLIGCVDNNASRRVMAEWMLLHAHRDTFWIDAGNDENSGQVVCGFLPSDFYRISRSDPRGGAVFSLPFATEVYPSLLDNDKFNSELSCAELAQSAPQNMMANITAAALVLNFAQKILRGEPLRSHGAVFSLDNSFKTLLNTPDNLAKVAPGRLREWERSCPDSM